MSNVRDAYGMANGLTAAYREKHTGTPEDLASVRSLRARRNSAQRRVETAASNSPDAVSL